MDGLSFFYRIEHYRLYNEEDFALSSVIANVVGTYCLQVTLIVTGVSTSFLKRVSEFVAVSPHIG